jgi:GT2 family glycosyltransferase
VLSLGKPQFPEECPVPRFSTRLRARGKFLFDGHEKFYVRGVTYGPFRPVDGSEYGNPASVESDFDEMSRNGVNTIRTYTVPPRWLLDAAERHGLRVLVGLPWEQHVTFLDTGARRRGIEEKVRAGVRAVAGHAAVLGYTIGNEIPASIVRWHGRRRVERFLERLYRIAKAEDPESAVTYVNFPPTEYLQLPFVDFVCFNVYLENPDRLESYIARLQNIAGDQPLVLAEIGLDSQRNGQDTQALSLDWQVRAVFAGGGAGAFVFSWTDEWHRGGHDIEDWDFGLTDRDRNPKPSLTAIRRAFAEVPFPPDRPWPRISVVVCSYNGSATIGECCEGLSELEYPDFEVIVVDDGSVDDTAAIAESHGFRIIRTENRGLSRARNTGMEAATGEIVAYLDDDARPDPQWLTYLATTFVRSNHVAVGGPNISPPEDGFVAACVANSPGNPTHILISDTEAEHVPGCNMAFRKEDLKAIGGFDPRFRIAGDDVDVCWSIAKRGTLGFSPGAMVWHHRRRSIRAFWRQQANYGRAEGILELKWPEKYNRLGHLSWQGRIYGNGSSSSLFARQRIYHGVWGSGMFQSIYERTPGTVGTMTLTPEWYLLIAALSGCAVLGIFWRPLLLALPLLVLASGILAVQAIQNAARSSFPTPVGSRLMRWKLVGLTAFLHLAQPLARLGGRLRHGLTPWRRPCDASPAWPVPRTSVVWSETWKAPEARLAELEEALREARASVERGSEYDPWDLEIRAGTFGTGRVRMALEEHGGGQQLIRFRSWPRLSRLALGASLSCGLLSGVAALDHAWGAGAVLGVASAWIMTRALGDCAAALGCLRQAVGGMREETEVRTGSRVVPLRRLLRRLTPGSLPPPTPRDAAE